MRSSDDLDQMLDEALVSYCDVEPRHGIEARVLRRARAPRGRWGWLVLVPVMGALILAIASEFRTVPPPYVRPVVIAEVPKLLVVPTAGVDTARVRKRRSRIALATVGLPRKGVFPTPTPLTPEEQAMVLLASRSPRETVLLAGQGEITPITIPELRIEPLQSDGD